MAKTRVEVEQRRQQAYKLYLMGFSTTEIAESLKIDDSNVSRALTVIRRRNGEWFDRHKDWNARYRCLFKEAYDRVMETIREAWRVYYEAEKPEVKSSLLARVQTGIALYCRLLNVAAPGIDQLWVDETATRLQAELDEWAGKREREKALAEEERMMQSRILPV